MRLETRDVFKKVRDTKGTFHAKMGTIKDRNDMDVKDVYFHPAYLTYMQCTS